MDVGAVIDGPRGVPHEGRLPVDSLCERHLSGIKHPFG